jgi:chemotaxis protein CheD
VNVAESSKQTISLAASAPMARERVSLGLGCVVLAETPSIVRTVLGSCVAVILHVPRLRISTLCHAQMPEKHRDGRCFEFCPKPCYVELPGSNEMRYVTCCMRYMLRELGRLHVAKKEIVSTVVGGANVLRNIDPQWSVAGRNVTAAMAMLEKEKIRVAYSDVGGTKGRVIEHFSDLNRTKVRYHDTGQ